MRKYVVLTVFLIVMVVGGGFSVQMHPFPRRILPRRRFFLAQYVKPVPKPKIVVAFRSKLLRYHDPQHNRAWTNYLAWMKIHTNELSESELNKLHDDFAKVKGKTIYLVPEDSNRKHVLFWATEQQVGPLTDEEMIHFANSWAAAGARVCTNRRANDHLIYRPHKWAQDQMGWTKQ